VRILSPLPLPIGLWGPTADEHATRRRECRVDDRLAATNRASSRRSAVDSVRITGPAVKKPLRPVLAL
jgi:hypothetical protein